MSTKEFCTGFPNWLRAVLSLSSVNWGGGTAKEHLGVSVQISAAHYRIVKVFGLVDCESHDAHAYKRNFEWDKDKRNSGEQNTLDSGSSSTPDSLT
jgi:hypothetical protein